MALPGSFPSSREECTDLYTPHGDYYPYVSIIGTTREFLEVNDLTSDEFLGVLKSVRPAVEITPIELFYTGGSQDYLWH